MIALISFDLFPPCWLINISAVDFQQKINSRFVLVPGWLLCLDVDFKSYFEDFPLYHLFESSYIYYINPYP